MLGHTKTLKSMERKISEYSNLVGDRGLDETSKEYLELEKLKLLRDLYIAFASIEVGSS